MLEQSTGSLHELTPVEVLKHFYIDFDGPKNPPVRDLGSLWLQEHLRDSVDIGQALWCINRLVQEGLLIEMSSELGGHPVLGRRFVNYKFSQQNADNGEYDCVVKGWSEVYRRYKESVLPVEVINFRGDEDIGTCFIAGNRTTLFTAQHVIDGAQKFRITDPQENKSRH
jgi:hypothetical protein